MDKEANDAWAFGKPSSYPLYTKGRFEGFLKENPDLALQDWLRAEKEWFEQQELEKDNFGHLPPPQIYHGDTIQRRAYEIFKARTQ